MKKKFAYLFNVGYKIVWSGETDETLTKRLSKETPETKAEVADFIAKAKGGWHMSLETGEMILCTEG